LRRRAGHQPYTVLTREMWGHFLQGILAVSCFLRLRRSIYRSHLCSLLADTLYLQDIHPYTNYSLFSRNIYVGNTVAIVELRACNVAVPRHLEDVSWECSNPLGHRVLRINPR
jgi:hypothetical protein